MEPTIITNVEDLAREDSFGPVMIISIFEMGERRDGKVGLGLGKGVWPTSGCI